ncbi:MAG: 3-phosphoshikimate 1-carboxyvinyltransferase [Asticcacaulis sp.]
MTQTLTSNPATALKGVVRAPGDKSVSHRSMIFGALAHGTTTVTGLLEGDDVLATKDAMIAFGAKIEKNGDVWTIEGKGGFEEPDQVIDCGNAGTGVRLIMGAAGAFPITTTYTGDHSLVKRPMGRVLDPLAAMGVTYMCRDKGRLPLTMKGGNLKAISYRLPMASAQVKSAVLLAGLRVDGVTEVIEPEKTRDHTERMLRGFGAVVDVSDEADGRHIKVRGGQKLTGTHISVPGDPSSAAFPLVAGIITPGSEVTVLGVMLNDLRTGLFTTLIEMGADLTINNMRDEGGEPVGDITARYSRLTGVTVPEDRAPAMIDEYPILAVAAATAQGQTIMRGIGEMRVKESDRIALTANGLKACGVDVVEEPEGMIVIGGAAIQGDATITTRGDHRIAMSHLVLGLVAQKPISVDEPGMIATSFPTFVAMMNGLGANITA